MTDENKTERIREVQRPQGGEGERAVKEGGFQKRGSLQAPQQKIQGSSADGPTAAPQAQAQAAEPSGGGGDGQSE